MSYEVTVIVTEIEDTGTLSAPRTEVTRAVVRDHERADAERRAIALLGGNEPTRADGWPHPYSLTNGVREIDPGQYT